MSLKHKLEERARELGLNPKRSLGQNFLINSTVVDRIVARVRSLSVDHSISELIEVGPGLGAITDELVGVGLPLQLVEMDSILAKFWRARGVVVEECDALQWDWEQCKVPTLLASNLPYQISASLVVDRCLGPSNLRAMVLMFQKEVAQRIRAEASSQHYGLLSVMAQVFWEVDGVVDASPRDFWPAPKVASRVLAFRRRQVLATLDRDRFLSFVKQAFAQRRKLVAKNLSSYPGAKNALAELDFDPGRARAEEISPKDFVRLFMAATGMKDY